MKFKSVKLRCQVCNFYIRSWTPNISFPPIWSLTQHFTLSTSALRLPADSVHRCKSNCMSLDCEQKPYRHRENMQRWWAKGNQYDTWDYQTVSKYNYYSIIIGKTLNQRACLTRHDAEKTWAKDGKANILSINTLNLKKGFYHLWPSHLNILQMTDNIPVIVQQHIASNMGESFRWQVAEQVSY